MYSSSNSVPAGRGFLVKANAADQSVTLNQQQRHSEQPYLCVSVDDDKAYVKLTEGVSMPLISFRGKSSSLYLSRDNQPYIMLVRDNANSITLNYAAHDNGRHHLNVNTEGLETDYLHLIDRLTGADIDLLQTPSYSFESHRNDYASRFQLRFTAASDDDTDREEFAYYANGQIFLFGIGADASLQVIDMTGRIVLSHKDVSGNISTTGTAPGVYVVKLITSGKTRVQKIVIN